MLKGVALPGTTLHHMALLENEEAIQVSVMELVNALMNGSIELKRGELVLRALNTAVRNSRCARFNIDKDKKVTEAPHYEPEEDDGEQAREEVRTEIARIRAEAAQQTAEKMAVETPPTLPQKPREGWGNPINRQHKPRRRKNHRSKEQM